MAYSRYITFAAVGFVLVWCLASVLFLSLLFRQAVQGNEEKRAELTLSVALDIIQARITNAASTVVRAATTVAFVTTQAANCSLAQLSGNSFDPSPIVGVVSSANLAVPSLQGAGVMTYDGSSFDNKISFEITNGSIVSPACPQFLYGYTTTNLTYESYCIAPTSNGGSMIDYARGTAYTGPDYGFTPEERILASSASTANAAFLPIFNLVGRQSLTYEYVLSQCSPKVIAFGQTNLLLLSAELAGLMIDSEIVSAYLVEISTGQLTAASNASAVVNVVTYPGGYQDQQRVGAVNSTDKFIASSAKLALGHGNELVDFSVDGITYAAMSKPYRVWEGSLAPLDWVSVVVIKKRSLFVAASDHDSVATYAAGMVLSFFLVLLFTAGVWICATKHSGANREHALI
jgi:hypothetical protein